MTNDQRKQLVTIALTALVMIIVQVAAVYGIVVPVVHEAVAPAGGIGALSTNQKIVSDPSGQTLRALAGGKIEMQSGSSFNPTPGATIVIPNYAVTAIPTPTAAGNVTATVVTAATLVQNGTPVFWPTPPGNITATVVSAATLVQNGTPVFWPTPPGNITATAVVANSFTQAGTPVVAYATPVLVSASTPQYCVFGSVTITGTTTVTNHGLATPSYAIPWMAQAITGDAARPYSSISGITVTLGVYNALQTPAANATGAAVGYQICGTK